MRRFRREDNPQFPSQTVPKGAGTVGQGEALVFPRGLSADEQHEQMSDLTHPSSGTPTYRTDQNPVLTGQCRRLVRDVQDRTSPLASSGHWIPNPPLGGSLPHNRGRRRSWLKTAEK